MTFVIVRFSFDETIYVYIYIYVYISSKSSKKKKIENVLLTVKCSFKRNYLFENLYIYIYIHVLFSSAQLCNLI